MTPRLLAIMGSGETSPTMVKAHRELFARLDDGTGPGQVTAVLLDTPFGFQENADDIAAKAVEYFKQSVGRPIDVASFRSASLAKQDPVAYESALAAVRAADYVFAGPGSPTYALRQWRDSPIPKLLADKLHAGGGGCVVFASAAALTLGVLTVPVYEIYKAGEEPHWLEGLDVLAPLGLRAAVIPHFNNAEGGNHDTRYCYLGERRLRVMEESLPDDAFVLGVDEHTGLVLDLDAGTATVVGRGVVTARRGDDQAVFEAGTSVAIGGLNPLHSRPARTAGPDASANQRAPAAAGAAAAAPTTSPLKERVSELEAAFDDDPAKAMLELEDALVAWSRDTLQSDDMDQARQALRSMIVRLGEAAASGPKDPATTVGPFVEALLWVRAAAREGGRWADADAVRDALVKLGVEVSDGPQGSTWRLLS
ncbi:MAG: hypothetical protein QOI20_1172 [Acidimicrobiaceae bacterium]|jgi:cyanophycinase-like exopeptidase|nr:hypothetical protein [Acidimicrobiaceae bacterium]